MITASFVRDLRALLADHKVDTLCNIPVEYLAESVVDHIQNTQRMIRLAKVNDDKQKT